MNKKIRILFYTDCVIYGGHEIMMLKIIAALLKSECYTISVLYYQYNERLAGELMRLRAANNLLELIPVTICSGHLQGVMSFFQWIDIIRLIKLIRHKFDLVCVAQGDIELSSKMVLAANLAKIKVVSYIPGDFMPHQLALPLAWLRDKFAKVLYKLPNEFISISETFIDGLQAKTGLAANKIHLIENIVTGSSDDNQREMSKPGLLKLCIVGAVNKRKNQQFIIDWLCANPIADYEVYIIGDGPSLPRIRRQIAKYNLMDKVKLLGWQANPLSFMQQMDILIIPSLIEGVPLVMLEAALMKLPILAANSFGMADFLPSAMRFELNDYVEFESKLTTLLTNSGFTNGLIEENYQKVTQNNSLENFEAKTCQVFATITGQ